jgi:Tol biopolymer transport system component
MLTNPDEPWLNTPAAEGDARISPDQKWVAYASLESDLSQIFVMPFDHHAARVRVSTNGGRIPAWSADGQEIYFKHQQSSGRRR